jgi:hypothetical protein
MKSSPLEVLLSSLFLLQICILLLILILFYTLFTKYFWSLNKELILKALNYLIIKFKFSQGFFERIKIFLNKGDYYSNKINLVIFIFISVWLILIILLNIFILASLNENISDYVLVYNYINNKT